MLKKSKKYFAGIAMCVAAAMTLQSPLQAFATVYPGNGGMIEAGGIKASDSNAQKASDSNAQKATDSNAKKEAKMFLDEDFEEYAIGDSMEEWTGGDRTIVSTTATEVDAPYSMVFQAKAEAGTQKTTRVYTKGFDSQSSGKLEFSFDFLAKQRSGGSGYVILSADTTYRLQFQIDTSGNLKLNKGSGTLVTLVPYNANQWYHVSAVVDMDSKKADIYVDDVLVRAGETLNTGGESVDNVKLGISRDSNAGVSYLYDNIRVGEYEEEIILPESIEFEKEELYLRTGEKTRLQYKVMPEAAIAGTAAFESDDDTVVSVSNTGEVEAVSPGEAEITVTYIAGETELSAACKITVNKYSISHIYYVAAEGETIGDGTEESPFRTIEEAQEAVMEVNEDMEGDIVVFIKEGTYVIDETLEFTGESSGKNGYDVIYKAYGDDEVIISGGVPITGWEPLDDTGIYFAKFEQNIETRQLFVDGERATRARSESGLAGSTNNAVGHTTTAVDMVNWKNQSDIEMVYNQGWTNSRCPVESITDAGGGRAFIEMQQPGYYFCRNKMSTSVKNPWYIENAFELLDEPGEWYLDETGKVGKGENTFYYMPKEDQSMEEAEVVAPVLEELVNLKSDIDNPVENIHFEGISFQHATWLRPGTERGHADAQGNVMREQDASDPEHFNKEALKEYVADGAVNLEHTVGIEFTRCKFEKLGSAGIVGKNGCEGTVVQDCTFTDISGNGIWLGEVFWANKDYYNPDDERLLIRHNVIKNNTISKIGIDYRSSVGIGAGYPVDLEISNNTIFDVPYSGISVGWGWTRLPHVFGTRNVRIVDNHIYDCTKELNDGGAIYTLGYTAGSEDDMSLIKGNYVHEQHKNFAPLYLDEGWDYSIVTENVAKDNKSRDWVLNKEGSNKIAGNYTDQAKGSSPSSLVDNTIVTNGEWPEAAKAIMESAGTYEVTDLMDTELLAQLLEIAEAYEDGKGETWNMLQVEIERARDLMSEAVCSSTELQESWFNLSEAIKAYEEAPDPIFYTLTVTGGLGSGEYEEGEMVEVTAELPENMRFVRWNATGLALSDDECKENPLTIAMPSCDVTLEGAFAEIEEPEKPEEPENPENPEKPEKPEKPEEPDDTDDADSKAESSTPFDKWIHDEKGWKLSNANGTSSANQWAQAVYNGRTDWYRTNQEGYILAGWFLDGDGKWYYMNEQHDGTFGAMLTGWKLINGKWYYFNEKSDGTKGSMVTDTWIGGFYIDKDGVWQQ